MARQIASKTTIKKVSTKTKVIAKPIESKKTITHCVNFRFKKSTTQAEIRKVERGFCALKDKIPGIKKFQWGHNTSLEGFSKGFTHLFIATFVNKKALLNYLPHPKHQAYVKIVLKYVEDIFVMDI